MSILNECNYWSKVCSVGSISAKTKILIVGDSHAYQLIPVFKDFALANDLQLVTCVGECKDINIGKFTDNSFAPGEFDLIVNSFKTNSEELSREARLDLAATFSQFVQDRGSKHLIVLDNPFYAGSVAPRRIRMPELEPLSRVDQDAVANPITQNWKDDAGEGTYFYDPFSVLCNATECPLELNGKVLYLDNNHLSMVGVRLLEPSLIAMVNQILGN